MATRLSLRHARSFTSSTRVLQKRSKPSSSSIPVDSHCIPLSPPYSIHSHIPKTSIKLDKQTLLKLYRLSALEPPRSLLEADGPDFARTEEMNSLNEMIDLIEAVKKIDTSSLDESSTLIDSRIRSDSIPFDQIENEAVRSEQEGKKLLELAEKREAGFYVVPTPENVKGKKRGAKDRIAVENEED